MRTEKRMVAGKPDLSFPECYFCGVELTTPMSNWDWERKKVKKDDGTVEVEYVCEKCDPEK